MSHHFGVNIITFCSLITPLTLYIYSKVGLWHHFRVNIITFCSLFTSLTLYIYSVLKGSGSPKVTQLLGFKLRPSNSNLSLEISLGFGFLARDMCAPLRMNCHGFESNGLDLKPNNWVTLLDLNSFLSSPNFLVNTSLKFIKLVSNDKSELLKSTYLTSDVSTCKNFKHLN